MNEFHALTRPGFRLIRSIILLDHFTLTLDGVRIAGMYLDRDDQEWALSIDAKLDALPAPFAHWVYTFPAWAEVNAFLGTDAPQPAEVENNTVEDVVDMALRKAGRATYGELRAELAARDATPGARLEAQLVGACVAENRRLRTGIGLIATGIGSAIAASAIGDGETSVNLLVSAKQAADRLASYDRHETLPADVPVLAHVRADRLRQQLGARS